MSSLSILRLQTLQNQLRWRDAYTKTIGGCILVLQQQLKQNSPANSRFKHTSDGLQKSERSDVSTNVRPLGEKVKENARTASYTAIILAGVGVTGVMFWAIFRELFSSSSPNNVYSDALDRVKEDPRVQDAIGAPIKGFGEESRRRRRQHAAHSTYERNGIPHMRMHFYVQGLRNRATVHLETRRNPSGKMEYRYLFVQLDHYPHTTIILEDNRAFDPSQGMTTSQQAFDTSNLELASFGKK